MGQIGVNENATKKGQCISFWNLFLKTSPWIMISSQTDTALDTVCSLLLVLTSHSLSYRKIILNTVFDKIVVNNGPS